MIIIGPSDSNGRVELTWSSADVDELVTLSNELEMACDRAFGQGVRRVESRCPAADLIARRALLRTGFRVEGRLRRAVARPDGEFDDLVLYARLVDDVASGPVGFTAAMNSALPRTRVIAHVVIRDELGRVLLCETTFKPDWELPGGIVEPRESPRAGAIREVIEELGVERSMGALLTVDWLPPYLGWDDACELLFDGGSIEPAELAGLTLDPHEIQQVRLCTLAEAAELMTEAGHRRLVAACRVSPGQTAYLEGGHRIS